jgi:hypothetical protein
MILDDEYAHAFAKLVKLKNSRREEDQWSSTRTHMTQGNVLKDQTSLVQSASAYFLLTTRMTIFPFIPP